MADPRFAFLGMVDKISSEGEAAQDRLLKWYRGRGGNEALTSFLQGFEEDQLVKVVSSLGIQMVPTTRSNKQSACRNQILRWFTELDENARAKSAQKPCHWCSAPSSIMCESCKKRYTHPGCLEQQVGAWPTHLDNRYCRGCAKQKFDLWIGSARTEDLQARARQIGVSTSNNHIEMVKRLKGVCSYERCSPIHEQEGETARAEGAGSAGAAPSSSAHDSDARAEEDMPNNNPSSSTDRPPPAAAAGMRAPAEGADTAGGVGNPLSSAQDSEIADAEPREVRINAASSSAHGEDALDGPILALFVAATRQRLWSPFNLDWTDDNHPLRDQIRSVQRAGRVKVAQHIKRLPWCEFVSILSDNEVDTLVSQRSHFNPEQKGSRETLSNYKRRWLIDDGQSRFKFPQVPYTPDEQRTVTWNGKTTFTADEHFHADRVPTALSASQKRAKRARWNHKHGVPPEPRATCHLLPASMSTDQMMRKLAKLCRDGVIKKSPVSCTYFQLHSLIGYNTDKLQLVPACTLSCYQAALVAATGCFLSELGIPFLDPAKLEGLSFHKINKELQGSSGYGRLFLLVNDSKGDPSASAVDVFRKKEGVYIIHSYYFQEEDNEYSDSEPIHHYIVYNAGTRVLFLYPEVVVLEEDDINDPSSFVLKLGNVPFQCRLASDKGSYARKVRRLVIRNCQESKNLPMSSHSCITK